MTWTDDEIDELLVRYLDQELSFNELREFEQRLASDAKLQVKLSDWQQMSQGLRQLRKADPNPRRLGLDFANRVIELSRQKVDEANDPNLAPWIERSQPERATESAGEIQKRDTPLDHRHRKTPHVSPWWLGTAAACIAASLMILAFWQAPEPNKNTLLSNNPIGEKSPEAVASPEIVKSQSESPNDERVASNAASPETIRKSGEPSLSPSTPDQAIASATPSSVGMKTVQPDDSKALTPRNGADAKSSTVSPLLEPTAEQLKALEGMLKNPNGMFLFVVDVSLSNDANDLDALREILDRHDIAWASQLEIDDSLQQTLAKSRMINEAGRQGLIPDFVEPKSKSSQATDAAGGSELVSLLFVKARGSRLDAAMIEVMQRTEEFPDFSFDLAFDPPTQELMRELQFIQEASLPNAVVRDPQNVSSIIRRARSGDPNISIDRFLASPRRTAAMSLDTRRQGKLPLDAEMMNPISYALFIVRH